MTPTAFNEARRALGLSINGMAAALGMNRRTIMRMKSGEWPVHNRTAIQVEGLLESRRSEAKEA